MLKTQQELSPNDMYKILTGSVAPRPIAWVSTVSKEGACNLAPFSFYTIASVNPPVLCFAPNLKRVQIGDEIIGVPKDTLQNIYETGEFVVNSVKAEIGSQMVSTGGNFARGVSEFDEANITPVPSLTVAPPGVLEAYVRIECKLRQVLNFGKHAGSGNLVLGDITAIFVDEKVIQADGEIDSVIMNSLARLGKDNYIESNHLFEIPEVFDVAREKASKEQLSFPFLTPLPCDAG